MVTEQSVSIGHHILKVLVSRGGIKAASTFARCNITTARTAQRLRDREARSCAGQRVGLVERVGGGRAVWIYLREGGLSG